jgi:hypothetical protein
METKNTIVLEIQKEGRIYRMEMPTNAPLGEAYTVAGSFLDKLVDLINEHAKKRQEDEKKDIKEEKKKK